MRNQSWKLDQPGSSFCWQKILAKKNGVDWRQIRKPLELQKALGKSLLELIELVRSQLHAEAYTIDEICQILETDHNELLLTTLTPNTSDSKIT